MKNFPKTIYVRWSGDKDDPYLIADAELPSPESSEPIAVYELGKTGTLEVRRAFVAKRPRRSKP